LPYLRQQVPRGYEVTALKALSTLQQQEHTKTQRLALGHELGKRGDAG
jgi:hypothetical protein